MLLDFEQYPILSNPSSNPSGAFRKPDKSSQDRLHWLI